MGTLTDTLQLAISTQASIGQPSFTRAPLCCWELEESGTVNVVTVSTSTPNFTMLNQKPVGGVTRTTFMFSTVCDFYLWQLFKQQPCIACISFQTYFCIVLITDAAVMFRVSVCVTVCLLVQALNFLKPVNHLWMPELIYLFNMFCNIIMENVFKWYLLLYQLIQW